MIMIKTGGAGSKECEEREGGGPGKEGMGENPQMIHIFTTR